MGVHDYRCHLCGEIESFHCREAAGGGCEEKGLGADQAVVAFFSFPRGAAPAEDAFLADPRAAKAVSHRLLAYDWGEWEFTPCLDYRTLLFDGDRFDVWRLNDLPLSEAEAQAERARSEGEAIAVERDPAASVWVVNVCPDCWSGYLEPGGPRPCRGRTAKVAAAHGLAEDPAAVRAHFAWLAGPSFRDALSLNDEVATA